jgi:hypothetical protein
MGVREGDSWFSRRRCGPQRGKSKFQIKPPSISYLRTPRIGRHSDLSRILRSVPWHALFKVTSCISCLRCWSGFPLQRRDRATFARDRILPTVIAKKPRFHHRLGISGIHTFSHSILRHRERRSGILGWRCTTRRATSTLNASYRTSISLHLVTVLGITAAFRIRSSGPI